MTSNNVYCPFCGSQQEPGQQYCMNCGANIENTADNDSGVKIVGQSGAGYPPPPSYGQTPVAQSSQYPAYPAYPAQTYQKPVGTYAPSKENANIALIMGIVGFFIGGCITSIIGFIFLSKAKQNNEDPSTIRTAQILLWLQLIVYIVIVIAVVIFNVILPLMMIPFY
ncbi:MAG: zinc-ribbon domain-containing protein [Candidatus Thorarchaeota archaeon]